MYIYFNCCLQDRCKIRVTWLLIFLELRFWIQQCLLFVCMSGFPPLIPSELPHYFSSNLLRKVPTKWHLWTQKYSIIYNTVLYYTRITMSTKQELYFRIIATSLRCLLQKVWMRFLEILRFFDVYFSSRA